jgi:hypothetical protein
LEDYQDRFPNRWRSTNVLTYINKDHESITYKDGALAIKNGYPFILVSDSKSFTSDEEAL